MKSVGRLSGSKGGSASGWMTGSALCAQPHDPVHARGQGARLQQAPKRPSAHTHSAPPGVSQLPLADTQAQSLSLEGKTRHCIYESSAQTGVVTTLLLIVSKQYYI